MIKRISKTIILFAVIGAIAAAAYQTRAHWLPILFPVAIEPGDTPLHPPDSTPVEGIELSELAQKNLRLTSKPLRAESFWKTIHVPGIIIDRPGSGDRGIVAPVTGIVKHIHRIAGDWPKPGEPLVTVTLLSESLHQAQTDLFKATQDRKLAEDQKARVAKSGVAEARVIEIDQQISRFDTAIRAYRQDLINRGLTSGQIDGITLGTFVSEMTINTPTRTDDIPFELQEVKVELGQQVTSGQTLCVLANHRVLAIEGRAFRDEATLIERTMKAGWPVEIDFGERDPRDWPMPVPSPVITSIANTVDPDSRTFRFIMPIENQSRSTSMISQVFWRFRPGQRVRLAIRVEEIPNVFVLPAEAVVQDGAEWYVFRQNGDRFDRKAVHVVERTRDRIAIANDGSVTPGVYVAQTAAQSINRMLKAVANPVDPHAGHDH